MIQSHSRFSLFLLALVSFFPMAGYSATATTIAFSRVDLNALVTLVKPQLTSIRVNELRGEFLPGPALIFTGLEPQTFDLKVEGAGLADLRFNELRANAPTLNFETGRLRLDIQFEDQVKAIRSRLGSISMKGVTLSAWVKFSPGTATLVYDGAALIGELKGTGLLKPKWVIKAIHDLALKQMRTQIERSISRPAVQESLEKGLLTWAKFSKDDSLTRIMPGTVAVEPSGIYFRAE